jgi:hypothetical protein
LSVIIREFRVSKYNVPVLVIHREKHRRIDSFVSSNYTVVTVEVSLVLDEDGALTLGYFVESQGAVVESCGGVKDMDHR